MPGKDEKQKPDFFVHTSQKFKENEPLLRQRKAKMQSIDDRYLYFEVPTKKKEQEQARKDLKNIAKKLP